MLMVLDYQVPNGNCCIQQIYVRYQHAFLVVAFSDVNIAFKKPTKLSSIRYTGCCDSDSKYAVDGDKRDWVKEDVWEFRCSHTDGAPDHQEWWAVDLLNIYTITSIDIYGRTDDRCEYEVVK